MSVLTPVKPKPPILTPAVVKPVVSLPVPTPVVSARSRFVRVAQLGFKNPGMRLASNLVVLKSASALLLATSTGQELLGQRLSEKYQQSDGFLGLGYEIIDGGVQWLSAMGMRHCFLKRGIQLVGMRGRLLGMAMMGVAMYLGNSVTQALGDSIRPTSLIWERIKTREDSDDQDDESEKVRVYQHYTPVGGAYVQEVAPVRGSVFVVHENPALSVGWFAGL